MSRTVDDRPKIIRDRPKQPRRGKGPHAPLRLLLADDHVILLEALRRLLEPDFTILAGVTNGQELVDAAVLLKPDVVVSDISMPGLSGLKAGREILERLPKTRLVMLSMYDDPALREEAFRMGASAYVLKTAAPERLVAAVRASIEASTRPVVRESTNSLSLREREVLRLLAQGHTMKEAALLLGITPRTVAFHKYRIMRVLSVQSSAGLMRYAVEQRLI
ncbi:MAG TPA: response regulator transcription factor [Gemmatimonadales bacterium]|nr:response regulator transcription factor [Gemmatimonadales bacterium]